MADYIARSVELAKRLEAKKLIDGDAFEEGLVEIEEAWCDAESGIVLSPGHGNVEEIIEQTSMRWLQIPAAEEVNCVVVCDQAQAWNGHWLRDRHAPCVGLTCRFCKKIGKKQRYSLAIRIVGDPRTYLWEYSPHTALDVERAGRQAGEGLRGLHIRIERNPHGRNTPVHVDLDEFEPYDLEATRPPFTGKQFQDALMRALKANLLGV